MEEFLKYKAKELEYLIEERAKIDSKSRKTPKDIEDLKAISNLIKEISEQLNKEEIKETSKELADWNVERDELDSKSKKTKKDKNDIKDINEILKMLSDKLKEMSSRKEIEEYKAEEELNRQKLNDYNKQLESLNTLEQTLDHDAYQAAKEKIEEKIEQEKSLLSYNERIISTYNLLKESNRKLSIITEIESQSKLKNFYEERIPSDLLEDPNQQTIYKNQILEDEKEVKRISSYLNELKDLQNSPEVRKTYGKQSEKEKIQKEINSVEKYLNPIQKRLDTNNLIMSNYINLKETDQMIKMLSRNLSNTDTKENISTIIENCKRILPENLQQSAAERTSARIKENYYLDEEEPLKEIDNDLNETQKQEPENAFSSEYTPNFTLPAEINNKIDEIKEEVKEESKTKIETSEKSNSKNLEEIMDNITKEEETKSNTEASEEEKEEDINTKKGTLEKALAAISSEQEQKQEEKPTETTSQSIDSDEKKQSSEPRRLNEYEFETLPPDENTKLPFSANVDTPQNYPKDWQFNSHEPNSSEELSNSGKDIDKDFENEKETFSDYNKEKEVTGVRKSFKNIKKILKTRTAIIATALVLLSSGVFGYYQNPIKRYLEKHQKGNPDAITTFDGTEQNSEEERWLSELGVDETELNNLIENNTEQEYTYETTPSETELIDEINETDLVANLSTEQQNKTSESNFQTESETKESESKISSDDLIKKLNVEKTSSAAITDESQKNTDKSNKISLLENLKSDLKSTLIENKENLNQQKSQIDEVLNDAFYNSYLMTNIAQDEYAAEKGNWTGVKDENVKWWTDAPLTFVEDPNELGKDVYLVKQVDENGNLVGMGWTDEATMNDYEDKLNESIEQVINKGRSL